MSSPPDHAVALGMIVNELVTNALKYAYPDGKGPIRVSLRSTGAGHAELIVEDDGIGTRSEGSPISTGLGQRIVRSMGEKLRANIEVDANHVGTRIVVTFELDAKDTVGTPAG